MAGWQYRIRFRHLLTECEDAESVKSSMSAIADVLKNHPAFTDYNEFSWEEMANETNLRFANAILDSVYDYCDSRRIWVELD